MWNPFQSPNTAQAVRAQLLHVVELTPLQCTLIFYVKYPRLHISEILMDVESVNICEYQIVTNDLFSQN